MSRLSVIFWLLTLLTGAVSAQNAVSTLAGQAQVTGLSNGTGTNALFGDPAGVVVDAVGNYFVVDSRNHSIRKVTTNGVVTTFAGRPGVAGSSNGTGTNAYFNQPTGIAMDTAGNFYVSDTGNQLIRRITPAGVVTTLAGVAGQGGYLDGTSSSAWFNDPLGIAVSSNGTVFIADGGNHCLRQVVGGQVSTLAGRPQIWGSADGQGTNAQFNGPCGLRLGPDGNLWVSDANNNTIRTITPTGWVATYAGAAGQDGSTDGDRLTARFRSPAELVFDRRGNLFVADSFNQTIRKITTNGWVSTVAGQAGSIGAIDGTNGVGRLFNPYGLALALDGSLLITDTYNEEVRSLLVPFQLTLQKTPGTAGSRLTWETVTGKTYQVQYQTPGVGLGWNNLGNPQVALSNSLSQVDSAVDGQRIYRVLCLP